MELLISGEEVDNKMDSEIAVGLDVMNISLAIRVDILKSSTAKNQMFPNLSHSSALSLDGCHVS